MNANALKRFLLLACVLGCGAPVLAAVTMSAPAQTPIAFPNPWRVDQHNDRLITFDQMPANGSLKIFTVDAKLVKHFSTGNGTLQWDLTNDSGDKVASGIYLYLIDGPNGQQFRGKLAIIR